MWVYDTTTMGRGGSSWCILKGEVVLNDFSLIIHKLSRELQQIKIYPVADLHVGAEEFLAKAWEAFRKKLLSEPDSYIGIDGDMVNNAIKSSVSNVYAETMRPREQKRWLADQLAPVRDKILFAIPGNHEYRSDKEVDDNPLYDVCCKLDIEHLYRENAAFVKISLGNKANGKPVVYTLCAMHGSGGGIYTGATVNRSERFSQYIDGLDIMMTGHTHKGVVSKPKKLVIDPYNNQVTFRDVAVVGCTSWLEYGGYALKQMLQPASNDPQTLVLDGTKKHVEIRW